MPLNRSNKSSLSSNFSHDFVSFLQLASNFIPNFSLLFSRYCIPKI